MKTMDTFPARGSITTKDFTTISGTQTSTEKPTEKTFLHSDWLLMIFSVFSVLSFLFGFEANQSERTEKTDRIQTETTEQKKQKKTEVAVSFRTLGIAYIHS
jgi:hypothetical protein